MLPPEAKKAQGQQPPEPPVKPVAAPAQKIPDDGYPVALKGYVLGEPDALELSLFNFILALKDSTFIRQIDIVNKETKTLRGKQILEFALTARCAKHEL